MELDLNSVEDVYLKISNILYIYKVVRYEFLKEKMLQYPDQVISNDTETITYQELLEYAEAFGETLTKDKYGLLFESDLDTAKALLACLYANKTAILLSKRYGEAHTQRIIETVKLSYLITEDGIKHISDEEDECDGRHRSGMRKAL